MLSLSCSLGSVTLTPHWTPSDPLALTPRPSKLSWLSIMYGIFGSFLCTLLFYFLFKAICCNQAVFVGFKKRRAVPSGYSGDGEQRRFWAAGVQSWRRNQPPERPAGWAQPQLEEPSAEDWWEAEAFGSCPATGALDFTTASLHRKIWLKEPFKKKSASAYVL